MNWFPPRLYCCHDPEPGQKLCFTWSHSTFSCSSYNSSSPTNSIPRANFIWIPPTKTEILSTQHQVDPSAVTAAADPIPNTVTLFTLLNVMSLVKSLFFKSGSYCDKEYWFFLCVTEAWISPGYSVPLTEACPPNYSCLSQPRTRGRGGYF